MMNKIITLCPLALLLIASVAADAKQQEKEGANGAADGRPNADAADMAPEEAAPADDRTLVRQYKLSWNSRASRSSRKRRHRDSTSRRRSRKKGWKHSSSSRGNGKNRSKRVVGDWKPPLGWDMRNPWNPPSWGDSSSSSSGWSKSGKSSKGSKSGSSSSWSAPSWDSPDSWHSPDYWKSPDTWSSPDWSGGVAWMGDHDPTFSP